MVKTQVFKKNTTKSNTSYQTSTKFIFYEILFVHNWIFESEFFNMYAKNKENNQQNYFPCDII